MNVRRGATLAAGALVAALLAGCGVSGIGPVSGQSAPVLVQVENLSDARPQSGLQDAAIVYEYVTEGGISRFSAIYTTPPKGKVGPIRSARLVTISLAKIYGAIVIFSGGSTYIKGQIGSAGIPNADENSAGGNLFRDPSRNPPHNLYSDGSHLSAIASHLNAPFVSWSTWSRTGPPSVTGGKPVASVTVPVSQTEMPVFTYVPSANGWRRTEPDTGPLIDADTGAPLTVSTLIVQQVDIKPTDKVVDVNGQTGVDHDVMSGGKAQVFTTGREFDASWSQGASGPPSFRVGDGPAPITPGLVWICLVETGKTAG